MMAAEEDSEPTEFLEQPLPLARDIFRNARISRSTTERAVEILNGYLETLKELGISPAQITRAVATNILSEASNNEIFLTRIRIACGLKVEILDDGEMTRLIYLKTRRRLHDTPSMRKQTSLVLHVGPGNTRALLFKNGRITRYSSYRLGTHRTGEAVEATHADGSTLLRVIREHISGQTSQLYYDYENENIKDLIVIGYEIQLLSPFLTQEGNPKATIASLRTLVTEAAGLSSEERVRHYQLDYHTGEAIIPTLETILAIGETFKLKSIRIPGSDFERGLLLDLPISPSLTKGFQSEVLRSAKILGQKYQTDAKHAGHVAKLSKKLFEQTRKLHQLGEHDALLLEVAAILHECGGHISPRAHHKHSQYLIQNSEIFGLGKLDVTVVSLVARYHRNSGPKTSHSSYRGLSAPDRIRVSKLAAILRVADALERTHSQRVRDITVKITKGKARLTLTGVTDATAERLAMQGKGDLFHDVFGLKVVLNEQA